MIAPDMGNARQLLKDALDALDGLDGIDITNVLQKDKDLPARKAALRRQFSYAAHLADAARLEINNQFYLFAGEDPPEVIP